MVGSGTYSLFVFKNATSLSSKENITKHNGIHLPFEEFSGCLISVPHRQAQGCWRSNREPTINLHLMTQLNWLIQDPFQTRTRHQTSTEVYFNLCTLRNSLSSLPAVEMLPRMGGGWVGDGVGGRLLKLVLSHRTEQNSCCRQIGLSQKTKKKRKSQFRLQKTFTLHKGGCAQRLYVVHWSRPLSAAQLSRKCRPNRTNVSWIECDQKKGLDLQKCDLFCSSL